MFFHQNEITNYLFDHYQGTTVRVEFGDKTTAADPASAHVVSHAFPNTYGQPLAHFLRATAKVPDAQIITEHPVIKFALAHLPPLLLPKFICLVIMVFSYLNWQNLK